MSENSIVVTQEIDEIMKDWESQGMTAITLAVDGALVGAVAVADTVKEESLVTIAWLKSMGVQVWMVTGDNIRTALAIAGRLGIDNVIADVLPGEKMNKVMQLQSEGHVVAMVGDGINDSPALAQANLGIAIGAGTEIAIEAADVVLVRNKLTDVLVALNLSGHVFRRIRINFFWTLFYNCLGIPIAAGLLFPFFQFRLPPEIAGIAMALSSVSVVTSSLHLKKYKKPEYNEMPTKLLFAEKQNSISGKPIETSRKNGTNQPKRCSCRCNDCKCGKYLEGTKQGIQGSITDSTGSSCGGCCQGKSTNTLASLSSKNYNEIFIYFIPTIYKTRQSKSKNNNIYIY